VDRDRDPSGDYGYDLAHEETGGTPRPEGRAAPEHPRPAPEHPTEPAGDYGYDEAHGF
jgi:hypothetical protein